MKQSLTLILSLFIVLVHFSCTQPNEKRKEATNEESKIEKEGSVEINGFNLKFIRKGKGEPIVIVGWSDYYSKAFSKKLEERFELIFIDSRHIVPDCNISSNELEQLNLDTFSKDLDSVIQFLNLDKFVLIGHSIHGQIALDYATKYSENINGLVIIGGVSYFDEDFGNYKDELWESLANEERKEALIQRTETLNAVIDSIPNDRKFAVSYHYNAPLYWINPNYDASGLLDGLRNCPDVFNKLFSLVPSKKELIGKVELLNSPTLLILGKLDFAIPYQTWEDVIVDKKNINYILMENASHNPQTEELTE